jgi:NTP pyrophosphatase (non-canonical NTP hydrolase)
MKNYIDTERIQRLSDVDKDVPIYQKVIKLSEESGELSQAFLKFDKAKNTSASAGGKVEDVLEEACDVLNVTIDIINALTRNSPVLELYTKQLFQKKLDKWEAKQKGEIYNENVVSFNLEG